MSCVAAAAPMQTLVEWQADLAVRQSIDHALCFRRCLQARYVPNDMEHSICCCR